MATLQELVTMERAENLKKYRANKDVKEKEKKLRQSQEELRQSEEQLRQSGEQLTLLQADNPNITNDKYKINKDLVALQRESYEISIQMQRGITNDKPRFDELTQQIEEKILEKKIIDGKYQELTKAEKELTKAQEELKKAQEEVTKAKEEVTIAQEKEETIKTVSEALLMGIKKKKEQLHNNKNGGKKYKSMKSKKYRKKSKKHHKKSKKHHKRKSRNKRR